MGQPDYTQQLLLQLNQQRSKGYLCDVIIVVENALFRAHKNVLAACSSYFKYLVLHENLITLNTEMVKPFVFNQVLDFIYTGQLPSSHQVSHQSVLDLLRAASYLQLSDLVALCRRKLKPTESSHWASSNNRHLQAGQSFQEESLEVRQSFQNGLKRDEEKVEINQGVETSLKIKLVKKSRTGSTSSSNSLDDGPLDPALEQWYPTVDWQIGTSFSREDSLDGCVRTTGQGVEQEESVQGELEDQVKVREVQQDSQKSGSEDEEWKRNKKAKYILHQPKHQFSPSLQDSPYLCIPCGTGFPSSEQLIAHVSTHPADDLRAQVEIAKEESIFKSEDQDGENLPSKSVTEEADRDPAASRCSCSVCGKIYTDAVLLSQHERSHSLSRSFPCNICGKLFTQRGTMTRHMRSHLGLKPFACEECGMRFTRQYRKMEHMRIHLREKPYQCELCGMKFTHQRSIMSHLKMHSTVS